MMDWRSAPGQAKPNEQLGIKGWRASSPTLSRPHLWLCTPNRQRSAHSFARMQAAAGAARARAATAAAALAGRARRHACEGVVGECVGLCACVYVALEWCCRLISQWRPAVCI